MSVCFLFIPLFLVSSLSAIFIKRLLLKIRKNRRILPVSQNYDDNTTAGGNREEILRQPATEETSRETTKKRYIKPAITLGALVVAMAISLLPSCIYWAVSPLIGSFNSTISYALYFVLQLNPLLDPIFFAATQKDIRVFYGKKIRATFRTFCNPN